MGQSMMGTSTQGLSDPTNRLQRRLSPAIYPNQTTQMMNLGDLLQKKKKKIQKSSQYIPKKKSKESGNLVELQEKFWMRHIK